jgi:peptidyl-prolyl cis-trans isomerase D
MLNVLRDSFKEGKFLKLVLVAVGVSLVAFLGSYFVGDSGGVAARDWVAQVNGEPIPEWQFRQEARRLDERYSQMFGDSYEQIKPQLQIRLQAFEKLISEELIRQDARRMGLSPSAAEVAEVIRQDPSLQEDGRFVGASRYKEILRRNYPGGHAAYERFVADSLLQQKWTGFVTQPVSVDEEDLRESFRQRTEKTAIDYVYFNAADQEVDRDPDEATLRDWYDTHLDDYAREAGRNLRYLLIDRQSQLEKIEVSASDLTAHYEANQATFSHPEQRRARHILLRVDSAETKEATRAEAEALLERIRGGEDFAQLAGEHSDDTLSAQRGGDLDFFGRDQMLEEFETAVFDTPVGSLAPLTETIHGFHIIEVTDSRQAGVAPLADVEDDIRRIIRLKNIDARLHEEATRVRAAIGDAAGLEAGAAAEGLEIREAFYASGDRIPALGPSPDFGPAVEALETGTLSDPVRVGTGVALIVVDEVLPPAPAPFEEVEVSVRAAVVAAQGRDAAVEAARKAQERHGELGAIAKAVGDEVKSSGDLAPGQSLPGIGGADAALRAALFGDDVTDGQTGIIEVPAGAIVYQVTGREPFDPARFEAERGQLRGELLQERRANHAQSILNRLRETQEVLRNPDYVDLLVDSPS